MSKPLVSANYNPAVFDVEDMEAAKKIILTYEKDLTVEQRWENEAPYLMTLMDELNITKDSLVLDHGTGIGRLAKPIIEKYGCKVVGTDISMNMRALANIYVNNHNFFSLSPQCSDILYGKVDVAISVWVLQHCLNLEYEIENLKKILKPGAKLFVVNERNRMVPTDQGWMNDSKDIFMALQGNFETEKIEMLDANVVSDLVARRTFYGIFKNKV